MSLRKAATLSVVQTMVTFGCAFLSVKITSFYLGPAGMGVLGQLLQFITLMYGLVASGVNNGVIRRMAALTDEAGRHSLLATSLKVQLASGVVGGVAVAFLSDWFAASVLHDVGYRLPVLVFAFSYVAGMVGTTIFGGANASKDYRVSTLYSISGSVSGLVLFAALCPIFGTYGALLGIAVAPILTSGASLWFALQRPWWPMKPFRIPFSPTSARMVLMFVPAAAVSNVGAPLVQLLLRDQLIARSGLEAAGYLQAIARLSDLYLSVVTTLLIVHYLRRFSEIRHAHELRREVGRTLLLVLPAACGLSAMLYVGRDLLILLMLTKEFEPMRDLFFWQMLGNVLRVAGAVFAYLITAKMHPAAAMAYMLLMHAVSWGSGCYLIDLNGAVGATQAYALASAFATVIGAMAFLYICRKLRREEPMA